MSVREKLNKLLGRYGYKIIKIDRFKKHLIDGFDNSENFCFIQIGANDGIKFDDLYSFVTSRKCRGIVVEPIEFYFKKLKKNYSKYPDIIPLNYAVHSSKKYVDLFYVNPEKLNLLPEWAEGIGSLSPRQHLKEKIIPTKYIISEKVKSKTLMEIINESNFLQVNLLQIDVEGYDGEVIKMIDFSIIKPKIIKYEHKALERKERRKILQLLN